MICKPATSTLSSTFSFLRGGSTSMVASLSALLSLLFLLLPLLVFSVKLLLVVFCFAVSFLPFFAFVAFLFLTFVTLRSEAALSAPLISLAAAATLVYAVLSAIPAAFAAADTLSYEQENVRNDHIQVSRTSRRLRGREARLTLPPVASAYLNSTLKASAPPLLERAGDQLFAESISLFALAIRVYAVR